MYFLSKLLPIFVLPLGFSLILLFVGLVRKRRRLIWAGVVILFVSSNPMATALDIIRNVDMAVLLVMLGTRLSG